MRLHMDYNKKIILNFLNKNLKIKLKANYRISYSNVPIICSYIFRNKIKINYDGKPFIHVRKETYEWNPNHHNFKKYLKLNGPIIFNNKSILIDCLNERHHTLNFKKRIFVPWCLLSFSSRNIDMSALNNKLEYFVAKIEKPEFCAFMYSNTGKEKTYKYKQKISISMLLKKLKNFVLYKFDKTRFWKNNYYQYATIRSNFYKILSRYKYVGTPKGKSRFSEEIFNEAVELLRPYKFNIAFENSLHDGWVTEKIVNSFLAGCIPIYFGHKSVFNYFNKKAFIYAGDFDSFEDLASYVMEVDRDFELYNKYINEPICTISNYKNLTAPLHEISKY